MGKEQYVSFETSQLLKGKGFDWDTDKVYERNIMACRYEDYPMPTQATACSWLREEKDIDIIPFHERLPHDCYWCRIEHNLLTAHQQSPIYSTYEDAVEAALQHVLNNMI